MNPILSAAPAEPVAPLARRRLAEPGGNVVTALWRAGVFDWLVRTQPRTLTVLAYHRVAALDGSPAERLLQPLSVRPEAFREQVRYLTTHFTVISARTLCDCLKGRAELPPRAALITFDDGYRDNHDAALPILQAFGAPAVLFATTGCIGSATPFYWDMAALCFGRTRRPEADLPALGPRPLRTEEERAAAFHAWIAAVKRLPDDTRREAADALPHALGTPVREAEFEGLYLSWEQLARLRDTAFDIGAHTETHPILSRIPPERAFREILGSKRRLEERLGVPVTAFAYPNGKAGDAAAEHEAMLRGAGFDAAFTTEEGPAGYAEVFSAPLRIRRVGVYHGDTPAQFAAKVSGFKALVRRLRAVPSAVLRQVGR